MALFRYKREWYSKHFGNVLTSKKRYIILFGGRGCFHPAQKIVLRDGSKSIGEIQAGDEVKSFNETTGALEYNRVNEVFQYDIDEPVYVIDYDGQTICATKDHRFSYGGSWLRLSEVVSLWHENLETNPEFSSLSGIKRRRNKNAKLERPRWRKNYEACQRWQRLSANHATRRGRQIPHGEGSPDNLSDIPRRTRDTSNSKPQKRYQVRQSGRKSGMDDAPRKLYARAKNRLAGRFKGLANRELHSKRKSSFRDSAEVCPLQIHTQDVGGRIQGVRGYDKGHNLRQELELAKIKSVQEVAYRGRVYDLSVDNNHNFHLDCGMEILVHNSGKTRHVILKLIAESFAERHRAIYYCRHEFETIRKTTFQDIINFLKSIPELNECFSYSESPNGSMTFKNIHTGHKIMPFGLDDPDKTKGISEATHIWIDEIDKCNIEQFQMANSVLRTPQAEYLQFLGSFNPVSEKSWLRGHFFHPDNAYEPSPDYGDDLLIHHSTVYDNEYIDIDDYVRSLTLMYKGNSNGLAVNLKGRWGQEENLMPWLYNFEEDKHTRPTLPFLPTYPVYLSFDFNNEPFACVAFQYSPQLGTKNSFIHVIKEFSGNWKVEEMCQRIRSTFPASILYVTGDRNGANEDLGRNQTLYQMIAAQLGISHRQLNTNTMNLEHADSRLLCNSMIAAYPNFLFSHEGCPNLVAQCRNAKVDGDAKRPSVLLKDRQDHKNDEFDAFRYFLQTYFLTFAKQTYYRVVKPN